MQSRALLNHRTVNRAYHEGDRVYLQPGEEPPPGEQVHQGERGGRYFLWRARSGHGGWERRRRLARRAARVAQVQEVQPGNLVILGGEPARVAHVDGAGVATVENSRGQRAEIGPERASDAAKALQLQRLRQDGDLPPTPQDLIDLIPDSFSQEAHDRASEVFSAIYDTPGFTISDWVFIRTSPQSASIRGSIVDEGGNRVGSLRRDFDAASKDVHHDLFVLSPEVQGSKLAVRMNRQAEEAYRRMGFKTVSLHADIDVGKYAWARQGYDWGAPEIQPKRMVDFLAWFLVDEDRNRYTVQPGLTFTTVDGKELEVVGPRNGRIGAFVVKQSGEPTSMDVRKIQWEMARSDARRLMADNNNFEHSWDLAAADDGHRFKLRNGERAPIGKAFMLSDNNPGWLGKKELADGSACRRVGDAYFARADAVDEVRKRSNGGGAAGGPPDGADTGAAGAWELIRDAMSRNGRLRDPNPFAVDEAFRSNPGFRAAIQRIGGGNPQRESQALAEVVRRWQQEVNERAGHQAEARPEEPRAPAGGLLGGGFGVGDYAAQRMRTIARRPLITEDAARKARTALDRFPAPRNPADLMRIYDEGDAQGAGRRTPQRRLYTAMNRYISAMGYRAPGNVRPAETRNLYEAAARAIFLVGWGGRTAEEAMAPYVEIGNRQEDEWRRRREAEGFNDDPLQHRRNGRPAVDQAGRPIGQPNRIADNPQAPAWARGRNQRRGFDWANVDVLDVPRTSADYKRFARTHGFNPGDPTEQEGWREAKRRWGVENAIVKSDRPKRAPFIQPEDGPEGDDSAYWDLSESVDRRWRRRVKELR